MSILDAAVMGELRSLLARPSVDSWEMICTLWIERWQPAREAAQVFTAFCAPQLDRWPADIPRIMPRAWLRQATRDHHPPPSLALPTHLRLADLGGPPDERELAALASCAPLCVRIHTLEIGGRQRLPSSGVRGLDAAQWPALRALSLDTSVLPPRRLRRQAAWLQRVRTLRLQTPPPQLWHNTPHEALREGDIERMEEVLELDQLESLTVVGMHHPPETLTLWWEALRHLRALHLHHSMLPATALRDCLADAWPLLDTLELGHTTHASPAPQRAASPTPSTAALRRLHTLLCTSDSFGWMLDHLARLPDASLHTLLMRGSAPQLASILAAPWSPHLRALVIEPRGAPTAHHTPLLPPSHAPAHAHFTALRNAHTPLERLRMFGLRHVHLDIDRLTALHERPWWPALTHIDLQRCTLDHDALCHLHAHLPPNLRVLDLRGAALPTTTREDVPLPLPRGCTMQRGPAPTRWG